METNDKYQLRYGTETLEVEVPGAELLTKEPPPPLVDIPAQIRHALDNPIGTPPLSELIEPGESVVIVTSDITRYTGSEIYLPILLDYLNECGTPDDNIEIVIALGIHRKQTDDEHRKILGDAYGRVKVYDHECDDPKGLVDLGEIDSGLPVQINKRVAEADRVIVTGTVGLHYFAGFGGGRKGLVPGVASRETCMATHFAVFNPPEIGGKHPQATVATLEGNPVHETILAAARKVEPDFSFNTVLSVDKDIAAIFAGDLDAAHLAACEEAKRHYFLPVDEPADIAIISCGGAPKDINFIQSHKGLDYGVRALKEGGTAILLADCPDGYGNATFFDWFRYKELNKFEVALRENYEINGQTAFSALDKAQRYRVIMVTRLPADEVRAMGMVKSVSLKDAISLARKKSPPDPRIVILPDGGTLLPVVG